MTPEYDLDNCINELTPLRILAAEMEEPTTDRHFTGIVLKADRSKETSSG